MLFAKGFSMDAHNKLKGLSLFCGWSINTTTNFCSAAQPNRPHHTHIHQANSPVNHTLQTVLAVLTAIQSLLTLFHHKHR